MACSFPASPSNLIVRSEINRGAWGVVYDGELDGCSVAVKNIHDLLRQVGKEELERLLENFQKECHILKALKHPHIVGFMGAFQDPRLGPILVMEKMAENLLEYLTPKKNKLAIPEQLHICLEITQGVAFLHQQKPPLVHRDLNNKNIMFSHDGIAKIGDFGQSKLKQGLYLTSTQPGMVLYMPPEALIGGGSIYDESLDIFSLGVLMLEIGTQEPPVQNLTGIGTISELKRRDKDLKKLDKDHPVKPLVLRCLKDKPKDRPKVKEVLQHLDPPISGQKEVQRSKKNPKQTPSGSQQPVIELIRASMPGGFTLKHLVSKSRRRFQEAGFDLDLTYIKPHIIAMGFPAERIEGLYRNSLDDVVRFLDAKHRNHYRVYNLCSERYYDPGKFHGRVALFPFEEHNAPPFELIMPFCLDMEEWFAQSPRNVAVVHGTSGKGRTGVMICAYLLYNGEFQTAEESLQFFGEARTKNQKGITVPSQRRYVYYFGHLLHKQSNYSIKTIVIQGVRFEGIPNYNMTSVQGCAVSIVIRLGNTKIHSSKVYELRRGETNGEIWLEQELPACGNVQMTVYHNPRFGKKEKLLHLWFNTFFVDMHLEMQREDGVQAEKGVAEERSNVILLPTPSRSEGRRSSKELQGTSVPMPSSGVGDPSSHVDKPLLGACAQDKSELMDIYFPQDELDKANKDKKHFPPGFKFHIFLSSVGHQLSASTYQPDSTQSEPWDEDDENLSDTDSESEWNTDPGPVPQV